jgi:hypothetical protein
MPKRVNIPIPNDHKMYIPNGHKIYHLAVK